MELKKSQLKDDKLLDDFYKLIIENYHYTGNFLILIFHDAYDIITKTTDNAKLDESEEVYEYILCAICPVELSKAGLRYFEDENAIKSRVRDWVVEAPVHGFVFPAFIDRGADVNSIIYYTKNAKDPHPELMEEALGCTSKQTATEQKETFNGIIKNALGSDEKKSNHFFMEIQESLNNKIEEHNTVHEDSHEPIVLTNNVIQEILTESGVPEEITTKIEKSYTESFGDTPPLAETLLDNKALAAKAQKRKEEMLERQVKILETKLERFKHNVSEETATDSNEDILENEVFETITNSESIGEDLDYDIVLKVKPEKVSQIKSEVIDGKKYLVIPIDEDEQANVNGIDNLI